MSTYAEDQWQEVAERAIAQGQSENEFLLSCHVANRAAALRAYRRAAGYLADVEEETGARAAIITACAHRLIPQLNYPQAEGGYECEKCGMLFVPYVEPGTNLLRRAFASQLCTDVPAESTADPEEAFSGRGRS